MNSISPTRCGIAVLLALGVCRAATPATRASADEPRRQKAKEYLKFAIQAAVNNEDFTQEAWCDIAAIQAALGDVKSAMESVGRITEFDSLQVEALSRIAEQQFITGDRAGADKTLELAIERAKSVNNGKNGAYQSIGVTQARVGECEAAKATSLLIKNAEYKSNLLCELGAALWKAGDKAASRENFSAALVLQKGERKYGRTDITAAQVAAGDLEGARLAIEGKADANKSEILLEIAEAEARKGDNAAAKKTCAEVRAAGRPPEKPPDMLYSQILAAEDLQRLAVVYAAINEERASRETRAESVKAIAQCIEQINKESDPHARAEYLLQAARVQFLQDEEKGAKESVKAVVAAISKVNNDEDGIVNKWEIAVGLSYIDPSAAAEVAFTVMPDYETQEIVSVTFGGGIAREFARKQGVDANLDWIELFKKSEERAKVFADAAAGYLDLPERP